MTLKITLLKKKEQIDPKTKEKTIVSEEKNYQVPYAPSTAYLEYLELEAKKENPKLLKVEDVKNLAPLIVKTFENQFTEEEFFEGIPGYLLTEKIDEFISSLNTNPYPSKNNGNEGNSEKIAD